MSIGIGRIQVVTKIRTKVSIKIKTKGTYLIGQIIQRQEVEMEVGSKARVEEAALEGNRINRIKIGTKVTMPNNQKTLQLPSLRTKDIAL